MVILFLPLIQEGQLSVSGERYLYVDVFMLVSFLVATGIRKTPKIWYHFSYNDVPKLMPGINFGPGIIYSM